MSLHPQPIPPIPEETVWVAQVLFPKANSLCVAFHAICHRFHDICRAGLVGRTCTEREFERCSMAIFRYLTVSVVNF